MHDLVAPFVRVPGRAAGPVVGHVADHRPAVFYQPVAIARREPVLPLGDCDIGVDMDFALAEHVGEMRRLLAAVFRVCFPRIHRALEPARLCARLCGRECERSEHHQRFRALGMQQQQCGEDPGIAVPKRVPRITGGQTAGAHRPARVGSRRREQIVEIRMHGSLRPRIAIDPDIGPP